MNQPVMTRIDRFARDLTPFFLTLGIMIVSLIPFRVPGLVYILPVLTLGSVVYWAVRQPRLLPPFAAFILGIIQDLFGGYPLGVNALVFLTVHGLVVWQMRFLVGRSFLVLWAGFALLMVVALFENWLLISIFEGALADGQALFFRYLITVGLFPPLARLLRTWERSVLKEG